MKPKSQFDTDTVSKIGFEALQITKTYLKTHANFAFPGSEVTAFAVGSKRSFYFWLILNIFFFHYRLDIVHDLDANCFVEVEMIRFQ